MDGFFSGLVLSDVHQELARNIVSLRISENLFDDLSPICQTCPWSIVRSKKRNG